MARNGEMVRTEQLEKSSHNRQCWSTPAGCAIFFFFFLVSISIFISNRMYTHMFTA